MTRLRSVPMPGDRRHLDLTEAQPTAGDEPELLRDQAPCGYLTTTPGGTIRKVNDTFLGWTGYRRHELVDQFRLVDLLTAGGKIYHETHFAPALQMQGSMREIALEVVRRDGSRLPVLLNAVLVRDVAEQATIVRIAVFDATDRRAYERELMAAKVRAEQAEARANALARTLQRTLIPPTPPVIEHLGLAAAYRPASTGAEVGGDFYDVFQLAEDDWVVVLGDVCGKGAEAAVVTALVRYTLRAVAVQVTAPADALRALNEVLLRNEGDRFCTVLLIRLRRAEGRWQMTLANGGHPLPLLRDRLGGVREVGEPGSLVGVLEEVEFSDVILDLAPGEVLVLYTDGLTEARAGSELYGARRLARRTAELGADPAATVAGLVKDVLEFAGGEAQDDIAVVALAVPDLH